ncbi:methionyl-tRNA formyltransferase [Paraphotobacterium marinum]|uniref:Methionyl-tRNA formyltransferase n=1 Tax=Paraphotobacterium marinum TaxID=1755811 RepID=A0A220VCN0_9GAMM|nr:methionyl-tRNA formyltransferase [Paraphotobacterium marinum]ASK78099.1 methionyl-tRNA formyltransferase [Paraphotobacterium marinum]
MKDKRIIFAGTPEISAHHLKELLQQKFNIVGVYTQPDKPKGRGKKLSKSPVKLLAEEYDIPLFQPNSLKDIGVQNQFLNLKADLLIVVAYGQILPKAILDAPHIACINLHVSLLPKYRGAAPVERALLQGDSETGVTIMKMDEGLDTGDIIAQKSIQIVPHETTDSLFQKINRSSPSFLSDNVTKILQSNFYAYPQNNDLASYAPKLSKNDAKISWDMTAKKIERLSRVFCSNPNSFFSLNHENIKVSNIEIINQNFNDKPGTVIKCDKDGLIIQTSSGCVRILKIQFPGKKWISVSDLINSNKNPFIQNIIL